MSPQLPEHFQRGNPSVVVEIRIQVNELHHVSDRRRQDLRRQSAWKQGFTAMGSSCGTARAAASMPAKGRTRWIPTAEAEIAQRERACLFHKAVMSSSHSTGNSEVWRGIALSARSCPRCWSALLDGKVDKAALHQEAHQEASIAG